jgi:hypothetical protein
LVRRGARFDCFGDGLCCTDIHALGPVTRTEKRHLDLIEPGVLVRSADLDAPVFRTQESGACVLRSARGCELHARRGAEAKPTGCSRFPFGLVATPDGGRVTTEHRCPCRTLGERPEITPETALSSLKDPAGRLSTNGKVGPRVAFAPGRRVAWSRYVEAEDEILEGLLSLRDPLEVLRVRPFPRLTGLRWAEVADAAQDEPEESAYGAALIWFGNAIRAVRGAKRLERSARPWSQSYDRAEQRSPVKQRAEEVLADWLADFVWSCDWAFSVRSFEAGKQEAATLYVIALEITNALVRARVRSDRAAAEAITVVELCRQSEAWDRVHDAL